MPYGIPQEYGQLRCVARFPAGGARIFPIAEISLSFTHRCAQCTRCVLQLTFNRSPTAWLQPSDGRTNCRVYRSWNGIVEGRVCDRGNARCSANAPMFRDAAT
jgi:hypothetical protein